MEYRVFLTNFQFFLQETFDNIDEAIQYGRNTGFEFHVSDGENVVYSRGIFG